MTGEEHTDRLPSCGEADNTSSTSQQDGGKEAVFHPISLTGLVDDDDDDDDDNDDSAPEVDPSKASTTRLRKESTIIHNTMSGDTLLANYETAIEECFLLAVHSHDSAGTNDTAARWHWKKQTNTIPDVNMELEQTVLRTWVPREMFLPRWAKPDSFA